VLAQARRSLYLILAEDAAAGDTAGTTGAESADDGIADIPGDSVGDTDAP
jgi:hypothetical protein